MASRFASVKKPFRLIFCGVYYLTVLVYTSSETTFHLGVGGVGG